MHVNYSKIIKLSDNFKKVIVNKLKTYTAYIIIYDKQYT